MIMKITFIHNNQYLTGHIVGYCGSMCIVQVDELDYFPLVDMCDIWRMVA